MAEPQDIVLRVLREIQTDLADFRKAADDRFAKLEAGQRKLLSAVGVRELEAHK